MHAIIFVDDPVALDIVGGLSAVRRHVRSLRRVGVSRVTVLASSVSVVDEFRATGDADCEVAHVPVAEQVAWVRDHWPGDRTACVVLAGNTILDSRLLEALIAADAPALVVDSGGGTERTGRKLDHPVVGRVWTSGCGIVNRQWLDSGAAGALVEALERGVTQGGVSTVDADDLSDYSVPLRRLLRPGWQRVGAGRDDRCVLERRLIGETKKGAPDLPALVHTPFEAWLVRWLAPTAVTPNHVTIATTALAWVATACLATGQLGLGIGIALVVGVLDGVDGRLARLRLETSRLGEFEHHLDFLYEWSWWIALAYHFHSTGVLPQAWMLVGALGAAEVLDGVAKGLVLWKTGRTIDEPTRFDRVVRLFGGRRNVYVWILATGVIVGAAPTAFSLLAWWEAATAVVHLPRALWIAVTQGGHGARARSGDHSPMTVDPASTV